MNAAAEQLNLIGKQRVVIADDYQRETAAKCKSRSHAVRKCVEISNLEAKEVYGPLGLDQAQWSRIWAGTAFPNPDLLFPLMDICGNNVPVYYDALMCGFELQRIRVGLEAELEQAKKDLEFERALNRRLLQHRST